MIRRFFPHLKGMLAIAVSAMAISACESYNPKENYQRSTISTPMDFQRNIEHVQDGRIDLIELIDPEKRRLSLPSQACLQLRYKPSKHTLSKSQMQFAEFACAKEAFRTYYMNWQEYQHFIQNGHIASGETHFKLASNSLALAMRRNEIQDRIVMRSDALCTDFQYRMGIDLHIQNDTTFTNWLRNNQTRVVGGIGALFLNSDAVWALTNAATITGIPGYTPDTDQIEKSVMKLSALGMNQRRTTMRGLINQRRFFIREMGHDRQQVDQIYQQYHTALNQQAQYQPIYEQNAKAVMHNAHSPLGLISISTYSLENALGDVINYHNACYIGIGLDEVTSNMLRK